MFYSTNETRGLREYRTCTAIEQNIPEDGKIEIVHVHVHQDFGRSTIRQTGLDPEAFLKYAMSCSVENDEEHHHTRLVYIQAGEYWCVGLAVCMSNHTREEKTKVFGFELSDARTSEHMFRGRSLVGFEKFETVKFT